MLAGIPTKNKPVRRIWEKLPFFAHTKMRYNHIPDECFNEISREIDHYSSPMFMCYSHLLIATEGGSIGAH